MEIVDVSKRLAKHPTKEYDKRPLDAIEYIVIHHSATTVGDAFSFARYHVNNKDWPGIAYHYVILEDGAIQKTNDFATVSYHVKGYNTKSLGICLVGDFTQEILEDKQKQALKELLFYLFDQLGLGVDNVKGHNELGEGRTQCPALDMDKLRKYLQKPEVTIFVNNQKLDVPYILQNGTTYVAIRPLAESLGYEVSWDNEKRHIYLQSKNTEELEQIKNERDYYLSLVQKIKNILIGGE